jgi:uncharacterized membrane protein YjgN (DUF898 family)
MIYAQESYSGVIVSDSSISNDQMPAAGFALHAVNTDIRPGPDVTTTGNDLVELTFKGTLLTIVTLGIYRFWFTTNLRRWYWRNTQVGGHAFEYRGTGKELFIGFLIAIAILSPLYLISYFVSVIPNLVLQALVSITLGIIFILIIQYGIFRGRRYRLTRTLWRGLRFNMIGSAWGYAFKSFGWLLLTIVTLGLTLPLARRSLEGLKIRATRFGSAEGEFSAPVAPLMKRWVVIYVAVIAVFIVAGALMSKSLGFGRSGGGFPALAIMLVYFPLIILIAILVFSALWPWYKTEELRTFTNGTRIGPVSFTSDLPTAQVYRIYLKYLAALAGIGVVVGLIGFGAARAGSAGLLTVVLGFVLYLGVIVLFAVLKEVLVNQQLWRWTAATLTIHNLAAVDDVIGSAVIIDSATGEGFADAIDFGGV